MYCLGGQSEIVENAVLHGIPNHILDRLVTATVPFLSESDQVLEVNASMGPCPMEGNLPLIEKAHQKLSRESEKIRGFLGGHLLRCRC